MIHTALAGGGLAVIDRQMIERDWPMAAAADHSRGSDRPTAIGWTWRRTNRAIQVRLFTQWLGKSAPETGGASALHAHSRSAPGFPVQPGMIAPNPGWRDKCHVGSSQSRPRSRSRKVLIAEPKRLTAVARHAAGSHLVGKLSAGTHLPGCSPPTAPGYTHQRSAPSPRQLPGNTASKNTPPRG